MSLPNNDAYSFTREMEEIGREERKSKGGERKRERLGGDTGEGEIGWREEEGEIGWREEKIRGGLRGGRRQTGTWSKSTQLSVVRF